MQSHSFGPGFRARSVCKSVARGALLVFVISTSVVGEQEIARNPPPLKTATEQQDEVEQLRKSVRQLTAEVTRLRAEVAKLEKYKQVDYLRDLLLKEEQRAEAAQKELIQIGEKELPLQNRLDEIDTELRPDRIQQSLAGVGSMRPEQEREAIERRLSSEKRRIQSQLDLFRQNRVRLQAAITSAEASIATLQQRLREAVRVAGLRAG